VSNWSRSTTIGRRAQSQSLEASSSSSSLSGCFVPEKVHGKVVRAPPRLAWPISCPTSTALAPKAMESLIPVLLFDKQGAVQD
jgi:hypothetical protein